MLLIRRLKLLICLLFLLIVHNNHFIVSKRIRYIRSHQLNIYKSTHEDISL